MTDDKLLDVLQPHSGMATHRRLTAEDLRACFAVAVRAGGHPIPTLEQCAELLFDVPDGPGENILLMGCRMPARADKTRVQLLGMLPEVENYWRALLGSEHPAVFNRLADLRHALEACADLLAPETDLFPETSTQAGKVLSEVFKRGMRFSMPGRVFGEAGDGPCTAFVSEALRRLGYGNLTHHAIAKRVTRSRRQKKR